MVQFRLLSLLGLYGSLLFVPNALAGAALSSQQSTRNTERRSSEKPPTATATTLPIQWESTLPAYFTKPWWQSKFSQLTRPQPSTAVITRFLHDELGLTVPAPALFKKRPNKCLTLDGTNPFYPLLDAAFAQRFQNQLSKAVGAAKTGNEVPGDLGYGHDAVEHFFQHLKSLPPDVNAMALRQYLDEVSEDRAMRTDGTQPHGFTYLTALDTMNNTSLLRLAEIIGQFARYLKVAQTVPDAAPFTPADQLQVLHRFTYKYLLCQWSETKLIQWDTQLAAILKIPDKTLSADLVYSMVFADMVAMLKVQDVPGIMELVDG